MRNDSTLVEDLIKIKAVQLKTDDYFLWTSGIKSPIYCDNRLTMSYPSVRNKIVDQFELLLKEKNWKPDVIAGCATAGIPHAAWLADRLNLPMVYVRDKPKGHGKENQIEGHIKKGDKVVVIEDLISTGGSSINSALALREQGAEVIAVSSIFSYGLEKANQGFNKNDLLFESLADFDMLIDLLYNKQEITESKKEELLNWRNNLGNE